MNPLYKGNNMNMKDMYKNFQANPQGFLMNLMGANPQVKQVMDMCKTRNPETMVREICKQRNINVDEFMSQFR